MTHKLRDWIELAGALLVILMLVCLGAAVTVTEFVQRLVKVHTGRHPFDDRRSRAPSLKAG